MNDNINTLDSDAELRLTIMSSIIQDESRKTSERVKWGQKRRMKQWWCLAQKPWIPPKRPQTNQMKMKPKTIRLIFDLYLEGKGILLRNCAKITCEK